MRKSNGNSSPKAEVSAIFTSRTATSTTVSFWHGTLILFDYCALLVIVTRFTLPSGLESRTTATSDAAILNGRATDVSKTALSFLGTHSVTDAKNRPRIRNHNRRRYKRHQPSVMAIETIVSVIGDSSFGRTLLRVCELAVVELDRLLAARRAKNLLPISSSPSSLCCPEDDNGDDDAPKRSAHWLRSSAQSCSPSSGPLDRDMRI